MNFRHLLFSVLFPFLTFAQVTGLSGWDIYLDPGHSRRENMGIYNYSEAEKNLRVALHLRDLLLTQTDIDTVWSSRYDDNVQVSLSQRTDEANSLGAAWYHSLHSNAGPPDANNTLLLWGQYQNGQEKVPNGGKAMSDIMIDILTRTMRIPTIGSIGDCSFYGCTFFGPYLHVNRESAMPSELSESGFHTSPVQNTRNMNAEWKRLEAYAFYYSILKLHGVPRPPVGVAAGYIFDVERNRPLNGAKVTLNGQEYITDTFASLFHQYVNDPELLHNGFYFFEGLPIDTLEMIVEAEGYHSDTLMIAVSDTFITFVDVDMIDALPPRITESTPPPNATGVSVFDDIVIRFSRRMDRTSVESSLTLEPAANFNIAWENSNRTLVLTPIDLAQETQYTLTIAETALDLFAHPLDGNGDGVGGDAFALAFTTQDADVSPPQLVATYPDADGVNVELHPIINLEFDEEITSNSIPAEAVILENFHTAEAVPGTFRHYVVAGRSVFSFFPDEPLEVSTPYVVRVQPGLTDVFGNSVTSEQAIPFATGNVTYAVTGIDNFQSGLLSNWWAPQQSGTTTGIITTETSMGNNSQFVNLLSGSTRSMRLQYGWDVNANSWLIREYLAGGPPRDVWFDDSYILQVYIFGDGSGNKFRFAVDDNVPNGNAGNHEVSRWITIDWIGWRLVSWDLANDPPGDWIGNGVLEGTLRIDSFQLTYDPEGGATLGQIYLDDLRLVRAVVVGIDDTPEGEIPRTHALAQNYPNPFNPATTIRYRVGERAQPVKLEIFDMLGRKIATLVNRRQPAGHYEIQWDGRNDAGQPVASGTYLYRLEIGDFRQTRRMLLVK